MCGIFMLFNSRVVDIERLAKISILIQNRGPDYYSPMISLSNGQLELKLISSVLHLRGEVMQAQPAIDCEDNVLMFNGQVYSFQGRTLDYSQSDTSFLVQELRSCSSLEQIVNVFTKIEGPFAFIYWHKKSNTLMYGRDLFGRKSLCSLNTQGKTFVPVILSSVVDEGLESNDLKWSEVSCNGLHCINFSNTKQPVGYTFHWDLDRIYPRTNKCQETSEHFSADRSIPTPYLDPLSEDLKLSKEFDKVSLDKAINSLEDEFLKAVKSRFLFNNRHCLTCRRSRTASCTHAKVAVAFSGGIDSTLIAMALDKIMDKDESIDLITVAFKPDSPDRQSVGCAYKELARLSPERNWRLVLCDISKSELQALRNEKIRTLILPCDSVFDDGVGCACWFVGRATGRAVDRTTSQQWSTNHFDAFLRYNPLLMYADDDSGIIYTSPASMLYAGSGIDEQLGGYSSHRAAWLKLGSSGLFDEISFLMRRLSSRNLGRDDRVYCDHGRDLKLPFLDLRLVSFLNQLPIGLKMNLDDPPDIGPKKILRLLALKWGLIETGKRVKRAMQFGTRIANLEGKERGNDICSRLKLSSDAPRNIT